LGGRGKAVRGGGRLSLWCLTRPSTICLLYRPGQFYWWSTHTIKRRSHEPLVITSDVRDEHHKTAISHRDLIVAIVKYILFS
jgi:hypothetical protein